MRDYLTRLKRHARVLVLSPQTDSAWVTNPSFVLGMPFPVDQIVMDTRDFQKRRAAAYATDASLHDRTVFYVLTHYLLRGTLRLVDYYSILTPEMRARCTRQAFLAVKAIAKETPSFFKRYAAASTIKWFEVGIQSKGPLFSNSQWFAEVRRITQRDADAARNGRFDFDYWRLAFRAISKTWAGVMVLRTVRKSYRSPYVHLADTPEFEPIVNRIRSGGCVPDIDVSPSEMRYFDTTPATEQLMALEFSRLVNNGRRFPPATARDAMLKLCGPAVAEHTRGATFDTQVLAALDALERRAHREKRTCWRDYLVAIASGASTLPLTQLAEQWHTICGQTLPILLGVPAIIYILLWHHVIRDVINDTLSAYSDAVQNAAFTLWQLAPRRRLWALSKLRRFHALPTPTNVRAATGSRLVDLTQKHWTSESMIYEDRDVFDDAIRCDVSLHSRMV